MAVARRTKQVGGAVSVADPEDRWLGASALGRAVVSQRLHRGPSQALYLCQGRGGVGGAFTLRVLSAGEPALSERDVVVLTDALDRLRGLQHPRLTRLVAFDLGAPSALLLHARPERPSLRECIDAGALPPPRRLVRALAHAADAAEYVQRTLGPLAQRLLLPEELLVDGELGWLDGAGVLGAFLAAGRLPERPSGLLELGYLVPDPWWEGAPARASVFSLASTAFEALTGQLPFGRSGPAGLLAELRSGTLPTVSAWCPAVPAAVDQVFARAWSLEGEGFDAPGGFVKALRVALEDEPGRSPLRSGVHAVGDGYHDDPELSPTLEVPDALVPAPAVTPSLEPPLPSVEPASARVLPLRPARPPGPVRSYDPSWEMLGVESSPPEPPSLPRALRDDRTPEVSYDLDSLRTDHPILSTRAEPTAPTPPTAPTSESAPDITLELPDSTPELSQLLLEDLAPAPEDPTPLFGPMGRPTELTVSQRVAAPSPTPIPSPLPKLSPAPEIAAPRIVSVPFARPEVAPANESGAWRAVRAGAFERTTLRVSRVLGLSTVLAAMVAAALLISATRTLDRYTAALERARQAPPSPAAVVASPAAPLAPSSPPAAVAMAPPAPAPVATPPATLTALAPAPAGPSLAGPTEAARQRVLAAVRARVNDCVEGMDERRVVIDVTYEGATGAAQRVRAHAPFNAAPLGPCLQSAVRSARIGAFPAPSWDTRLVFPIAQPAWMRPAP
ncbi:MAG: hypothetical protein HY909_22815 [Deltaproteobacteria bacterium]|nr:hypothetical protein [Deltaproteobacteria bacterium]